MRIVYIKEISRKVILSLYYLLIVFAFILASADAAKIIGKISSVEGNLIKLDLGSNKRLKVGDTGRVYYMVKITGVKEPKPIYVAKYKITHVSKLSSIAQIINKTADIKKGYFCEINIKTKVKKPDKKSASNKKKKSVSEERRKLNEERKRLERLKQELEEKEQALKEKETKPTKESDKIDKTGRFILKSDGIVRDTKTDLEWMAGPDEDTNFDKARSWIRKISTRESGWRLPKVLELQELYQKNLGTRNLTPLIKTTGWWVWAEWWHTNVRQFPTFFSFAHGTGGSMEDFESKDGRVFAVRDVK